MTTQEDEKDAAFERGHQAAIREIFGLLSRELIGDEAKVAGAVKELSDARVAVEELLDELGVDYPKNLYLSDLVQKYLAREIESISNGASPCSRCKHRDLPDDSEQCKPCLGTMKHMNFVSRIRT